MKDVLIVSGFLLALILILGKLNERERTLPQFFTILLLLNFAFYHLISYLLYCPHPFSIPHFQQWAFVLESLGFILFLFKGPTHYGYCLSVSTAGKPFPGRYLLHFLPGIIYAAVYLPIAYTRTMTGIADGNDSVFFPGHRTVYLTSIFTCVIIYDIYLVNCIRILYPLVKKYPKRNTIFRVMIVSYFAGIITTTFWPFDIMMNVEFTDDVRLGSLIYLIIVYMISCRYPEKMILLDNDTNRMQYRKTQLQGIDTELVIDRLDLIMRKEKAFKSNISLAELAKKLQVRNHQLSEILNSYMKTTFANYINDLRIDEAKQLLISNDGLQINEISSDIGFNTLSVFYREFKKRTGMPPAEYRYRYLTQKDAV